MSAHSHELCGRMQGTCTRSADDLLEISSFHWSQRHMMLGDLSVCKHLPGNPGLTAHGEPVLENNIVLFLSCSFEEPAITASFLHLSLRSVLVVARNSNRELRESTASAITSHTGSKVLLMSSFWSHAESAQQQQKRNIHHDHLSLYSKSVPQPLNPHIFINISVPVDAGSKTVDKQMKYHWIRRTYPGKWHYDGNWWVLPLSGLQCKRMDNKLHHFFACSGSRWPIKWGTPQQCVCQHFHCEAWVVKAWYCTLE